MSGTGSKIKFNARFHNGTPCRINFEDDGPDSLGRRSFSLEWLTEEGERRGQHFFACPSEHVIKKSVLDVKNVVFFGSKHVLMWRDYLHPYSVVFGEHGGIVRVKFSTYDRKYHAVLGKSLAISEVNAVGIGESVESAVCDLEDKLRSVFDLLKKLILEGE